MTFSEAQAALCAKLDISLSDIGNNDLFSLANIKDFIQSAVIEAWDYKPWPFSDDVFGITIDAQAITDGYIDHPEDLMLGSGYALLVDGEEFTGPLKFTDYLKYKRTNTTGAEKIWAFQEDKVFINMAAVSVSSEVDIIGKALAPTLTADGDLLPFSPFSDNKEHSGNKAIVDLAYANALSSEKLKRITDGDVIRKQAQNILNNLWAPFAHYRSYQQSTRPMFDSVDFFRDSRRSGPIGNFNL